MTDAILNMDGISEVYQRTLGPLSLFKDPVDDKSKQEVFLERPITPINDEIKRAPTVFSKLANYVRRRIKLDDGELFMNIEDQESLIAVLLSEVSYIWPDLRTQPDDPFLTKAQNRELQRRIIVHIVSTCQILFQNYLRKLDVLNKRGVFTSPANIIRLKAQLASDANRFLDVQTVRRHILAEIKYSQPDVCDDASVYSLTFVEMKQPNLELKPYLSVMDFIEASRPQSVSKKKQCSLVSEAVPKMMAEMPKLDQEKLRRITDVLPTAGAKVSLLEMKQQGRVEKENSSTNDCAMDRRKKTPQDESLERVRIKRSKSLVDLLQMNGHSDEWEDGCRTSRPERLGLWYGECRSKISQRGESLKCDCTKDSKQSINDDLKRLLVCENEITAEDDIPPLLQFLRSNSKTERRKEELEEQLRKLEEREKVRKEREKLVLAKHLHAQPSYVTKKMPRKFTVRTSDTRLSNRNSLSSLTLGKHRTIYNHLSNEIGADTLKKLDANLFRKEEMTGVFEEIMKTMPSDHLQLDADVHVEPGPASGTMLMSVSSSIFNGRNSQRICNKNLQQTLKFGRLPDFQNDALCQGSVDIHGNEQVNRDLLSKSFGSWLTWWKSTVNSDDYMKYLSTQETDYLGVIFHFYNSDDEEENTEKVKMEKDRMLVNEQKLMAIMSQKNEFKPGLWNANSVLMGGLGQTPIIDPYSNRIPIISPTGDKRGEAAMKSGSFIRPKSQLNAPKSDSLVEKCDASTLSPERSFISEAQQRLEIVWTMLQMPESQKLDMTVKYSLDAYYKKLRNAINDWEAVAELIVEREAVILQLEKFERLASDPVRLLGRGSRGSKQLSEERHREAYNQKISAIEVRLKPLLDKIEKLYQDIVTYQGRPYRDKMACDRVEMLFWLQEERKNKLLEHDSKLKNLQPLPESLVSLHPVIVDDHFFHLNLSS